MCSLRSLIYFVISFYFSCTVSAQLTGVSIGLVHGTSTNIVQYANNRNGTGSMTTPGFSAGFWYATSDSAIHFRVGLGYEYQKWTQNFRAPTFVTGNHTISGEYPGTMVKNVHFLRATPSFVLPLDRFQVYAKIDVLLPVNVQVSEDYLVQGVDSSYSAAGSINLMNIGPGGGVRLRLFDRLDLDLSISAHLMDFSPALKGSAELPMFVRGEVCYIIGRRGARLTNDR